VNYLLETEIKPVVQSDNSLSLYQRYQTLRYRAIGFPGQAQPTLRPVSIDLRLGNAPGQASALSGAALGQALGRLEIRPFSDIGRPEITVARREVSYGVSPFHSTLDELG